MKKISILLISILISSCAINSTDTIDGLPTIDASEDNSGVIIQLYENQNHLIGLGFTVTIEGWVPNDYILVQAISPNKTKLNLMKDNKKLLISSSGNISFSVPYHHNKLTTGKWILVITGKSGKHGHYFTVP